MERFLIVNADDFGRAASINEGVEKAFRNGIVSSASLMANAPAFLDAINIARRNPALDVGVHLTLHEYPPLGEGEFLRELEQKGMSAAFLAILFAGGDEIQLVKEELRRQIEKVISAGVVPSHLDGHCHVHVHPRLFAVVLELAGEFSIKWIRLPKESLTLFSSLSRYLQKIILSAVCYFDILFVRHKLHFVNYFHGFSSGGNINKNNLPHLLNQVQPGLNELMCHVGSENNYLSFPTDYKWQEEFNAMTVFTKERLWKEFGIRVISYKEAAA